MLKLGLAHALLLDLVDGGAHRNRRKPRFSDSLVLTLVPLDGGVRILQFMRRLGLLDEVQLERLAEAEHRLID